MSSVNRLSFLTLLSAVSAGKRGLIYNDASLISAFAGSTEIAWAYNYNPWDGDLEAGLEFIPTVASPDADAASWFNSAQAAIDSGSSHLFSFNEPDVRRISIVDAARAYQELMNPFAGQAQLCAPAVGGGTSSDMGLSWLQNFLAACGTNCHIDCLNIHWYSYSPDVDGLKKQIQDAVALAQGTKPVYISEFGIVDGSDQKINAFLMEIMPWMDANDMIAGYAYFMVRDGMLLNGTELSLYGRTYRDYA